MKTFIFTLSHDHGNSKLQVTAQDQNFATFIVMQSEGCPLRAIEKVEEVKP